MTASTVERGTLPTALVPPLTAVEYVVLLPPGYKNGESFPLLCVLHGGGSSSEALAESKPLYEYLWKTGSMPHCVVASFSTHEGMGFYFDWHDGTTKYMTFFMEEWLPFLRQRFQLDPSREATWLTGTSMGGMGSLRLGFMYPEVFGGVAAMEPAIYPALEPEELRPRNSPFMESLGFDKKPGFVAMFGGSSRDDMDPSTWQRFNPACIVAQNAQRIREAGLKIYIECADEDFFNLHDGAEFLHNQLWQYRIKHEYHLCTEADHLGPSIVSRQREKSMWLGKMMNQALGKITKTRFNTLTPGQEKYMEWMKANQIQGALHGTPSGTPPPGSEPVDFLHASMLQYIRSSFPPEHQKLLDHEDGWNRLPKSRVIRSRM